MLDQTELAALIEGLDHPEVQIRTRTKQRLLTFGAAIIDTLAEVMQQETGLKSHEAARVLAQIDDPRSLEVMLEALRSSNVLIGHIMVEGLAQRLDPAFLPDLLEALPICKASVQLHLIGLVEQIGHQAAVLPLMTMLTGANSPALRYTIIQALGLLGDPQAIDLIKSFENDEDHHVRKRVQIALDRLNQNEVLT